jgi:hypothetical protein
VTDPASARFWAGRSVFGAGEERPPTVPFALCPADPLDGAAVGRAPSVLPARAALGIKGMPLLRMPFVLDATSMSEGAARSWAASARGASAAGAALLVTPDQAKARSTVLKASGVPLLLRVAPGDALTPEVANSAAALGLALASESGAPAVMAQDALPGLVEAARALTEYRAPVFFIAAPGRVPARGALRAAAASGVRALCLAAPAGPARFPMAALVGYGSAGRGGDPPMPAFIVSDEVGDGLALACALAAGSGLAGSGFPLRVAAAEESATDADWKATGDRLAAALRAVWEDAQRASAHAGVADPRDLTFEHLRALTYDAAALSGARLSGFDERLPWWAH